MTNPPIPGPKGKWFFGSILEFAKGPPEFFHHVAKTYGDVAAFRLGRLPFLHFAHPDLAQEVLVKHARSFHKMERDKRIMGALLGNGLLTIDGDFHKKQRTLSQPSFRKKRIQLFADAMIDETEKQLDTWKDGQEIDVVHEMTRLTMYIVIRTLFQMEVREEAESLGSAIHTLQQLANEAFQSPIQWPAWVPTPRNRKFKRERAKVNHFIEAMIAERRKDESLPDRGDLLSTLISAKDEDGQPMSDEQLRDELVTLFVAGHETTSNALSWTWYLLSQHPEITAQLHEEIDRVLGGRPVTPEDVPHLPYTEMVLKESMRLYPPAWVLNARCAIEDVEINGSLIPKGTNIFLSPYVLHRDPRFYHAPETFDPTHFTPEREKERHRYAYIPFGAGPRVCIGSAFAMMEATLLLVRLAQEFELHLQPNQTIEHDALITLVPKGKILMRLEKRQVQLTPTALPPQPEAIAETTPQAPKGCPFHQAA